ncbi:MAG: hypothetical protein AAGC57_06550 [Pseudomonadota bacterium]
MRLGDLAKATVCCRQAIARDTSLAEAQDNPARILERQEVDGARRHVEAVLAIEPGCTAVLFNLAYLHLRYDADAEAIALFERFLA